jgi:AcrR family transcriptional regulator
MTEKQSSILSAALKLFANEGFASTSTSKVAKEAGVSEGLIFRHFGNKEGLLNAVLQRSHEAAQRMMASIVIESDPLKMIQKTIEMPYNIDESEHELWRLTYALKWQTNTYNNDLIDPFKQSLVSAFKQLGYKNPAAEAELLFILMNGAATSILLKETQNKDDILIALKSKYNLI